MRKKKPHSYIKNRTQKITRSPSQQGKVAQRAGWGNQNITQSNLLKEHSRSLRKNMTIAEKKLWTHLRSKRFNNIRFRRQATLGNYIIDFISFDPKIIIEVDGSQHNDKIIYDLSRTEYLSSFGYKVLRYWNNEVLNNIETVLNDIWSNCFDSPIRRVAPPSPAGKAI